MAAAECIDAVEIRTCNAKILTYVTLIVISEGVVQTLDALATRLRLLNPFPSWTVADQGVLIISKMHFVVTQSPKVFSYCVSINQELQWSLSIQNKVISLDACTLLSCFSGVVNSVSKLRSILEVLDTTTVCMGNPDQDLVHQWHRNASSLHSFSGKCQVGDSVLCLKLSSFSYL